MRTKELVECSLGIYSHSRNKTTFNVPRDSQREEKSDNATISALSKYPAACHFAAYFTLEFTDPDK